MHFGLDIGSHSLKIICCQKKGSKFYLANWAEVETPVSTETTEKQERIALAEILKKLVRDAKVTMQDVAVAIPEAKVFSRVIQLPFLSDAELASAIEFEAEQYIPMPLDQVQLEYLVLAKPAKVFLGAKMEVLLIAAQKKAVDSLVELLQMSGLIPIAMETEILAVCRALAGLSGTSLLMNIGKDSSDLAITKGSELKFVYSYPTGGDTLTRSLASQLSLEFVQAEEYKKAYGLQENVLEGKVAAALEPPTRQIVEQIQKTINFYSQKSQGEDKITRLILAGGTALMPGISTYFAKNTGLETVLGNPFANFNIDQNFPKELLSGSARFATAVGLALRE